MYTEYWVVAGPSSDPLINIEATLVSRPVIAVDAAWCRRIMRSVSVGVVLSQRLTQLTGIEPAMGCDSGPPLHRNWVGRVS